MRKDKPRNYRYRVTHVSGPEIAKIKVGDVLADYREPQIDDDDPTYPNGYQTWEFWSPRHEKTQGVTGEFIGTRDGTRDDESTNAEPRP